MEEIVLKESESINFLEKMEQQGVFVKFIEYLDVDDENNFYFLDNPLCTVFRIDGKTGKLLNTISSPGQGPGELYAPRAIRVMNKMVFIPDSGFGGVKIFSIEGKLIKEFRTEHSIGWLDVNKKNEIYVREADTDSTPIISIYNMAGERIKKLIRMPVKDMNNRMDYVFTREFMFKLDSKENPVVLFEKKNILRKYNPNGELIWERNVTNKIIDSYPHKKPRYGEGGSVHSSSSLFNLDIDKDGDIFVGHVGGAMVFSKDGEAIQLIKSDPPMSTHGLKIYNNDNNLLRIVVGGMKINIYQYKKGGK
jgi:hypothetical protein